MALLQSQFTGFPALPPKTSLDSILETKPEVKGILSKLYSAIFDMEDSSQAIIKENWEKDLETDISEVQWSKILKRIHSSSICAKHGLIQFKIVHRLHMSKVKRSKGEKCSLGSVLYVIDVSRLLSVFIIHFGHVLA